jgi:CubicO group peptidase (beta-lactamase class C family)
MHQMKKSLLPALLLVLAFGDSIAQSKKEKLREVMQAYHRYNMFDGAVLVAEQGKVIYKEAFGLANREWNIPNTTDTRFMIGSVSKPITAMLVLLQVQKGLIDLDKTITDYIPEFSAKNGKRITIRQLLSHTSGMPNYDIMPEFFPKISRQNFFRADYMKLYMDSALIFEPGSSYSYSSWGYFTLGHIVERVTGKTYAQAMKDDILDPLGMNGTGSYFHTQIVPRRATGYDYTLGGRTSADFRDQSNTMGTGDLYSTVEDLFKLHLAISNNKLLNKQLTDAALTPGIRPARYGFGWFNQQFRYSPTDSVQANYHLGTTEGFLAFFIRIPATNSLVVFLCNSSPTHFFGIASSLLRVLHNKPPGLKQPAHKALEPVIVQQGINAALLAYDKMKADTAHYYIDWLAMRQLGEQLHNEKRYEDAALLFEKLLIEFPSREFMAVSLGDAYMAMNKKEKAKEAYRRALAINPKFEEAKNKLKALEQQ